MTQAYKLCPICGTPAQRTAVMCSTCGTSLTDVKPAVEEKRTAHAKGSYNSRYGETDLLEGEVSRRGQVFALGGLLALLLILCAGVTMYVGQGLLNSSAPTPTPSGAPPVPNIGQDAAVTNTLRPTVAMATVTLPPPSPTFTPTEGDCIQHVDPGDDLISMAIACGHRDMYVLTQVLEMNHLDSPELIQIGQDIMIPRPTPTDDPNAAAVNGVEAAAALPQSAGGQAASAQGEQAPAGTADRPADAVDLQDPLFQPTETLLPGVMWHQIEPNESMVEIAYNYHTSAEVLAQLNPEIQFAQCDYSMDSGGPACTVMLIAGQSIRIPAPTPTPTLSPTLSGSETPTPTLTPTYNAPSLFNPQERALFERSALITLRWVATGTLAEDEIYQVTCEDLTVGITYTGETGELYFIVPTDWQGADGQRHDYRWSVSVIRSAAPDQPIFTTSTRLFSWESRND